MRKVVEEQMQIGEIAVSDIKISLKSRDEIPKLLIGLQHIHTSINIRQKVFAVSGKIVPEKIKKNTGRPGLDLWQILVLGTLRLCCNFDYDKLQEIANEHKTLRQMLGHGLLDNDKRYALQTLKDNISLLKQ